MAVGSLFQRKTGMPKLASIALPATLGFAGLAHSSLAEARVYVGVGIGIPAVGVYAAPYYGRPYYYGNPYYFGSPYYYPPGFVRYGYGFGYGFGYGHGYAYRHGYGFGHGRR